MVISWTELDCGVVSVSVSACDVGGCVEVDSVEKKDDMTWSCAAVSCCHPTLS